MVRAENKNLINDTRKSPSYGVVTLLLILMVFSIAVSVGIFFEESLRLDEAQSLWQTSHSLERTLEIVAEDVHTPLYHIILHFWQSVFGNDVFTARALSLMFFVVGIPAIYFLGKRCFGRSVGVFSAVLFTLSPFMNWFGSEIRMYSLLALLTILNQYFFISLFKPQKDNDLRLIWVGYALTATLGIYTHLFFALILLAQALFYFLFRKEFPGYSFIKFVLTAIFLLVALSPWILFTYSVESVGDFSPLLTPPGIINIFNTFSNFLFGFQVDHVNSILLSIWPIVTLMGFLALQKNKRVSSQAIYFVLAIIVPITAAFIVSQFTPAFLSRYLIVVFPALLVLLSWLFSLYTPRVSWVFKGLTVGVMTATLFIQTVSVDTPVKENYKDASQYVSSQVTGRDIVAISAPFTIYPLEYYYNGEASVTTVPAWDRTVAGTIPDFSIEETERRLEDFRSRYQTMWLLLSYDQGYEEDLRNYLDNNLEKLEEREFSYGLSLHVYKLQYNDEEFEDILVRLANDLETEPEEMQ